MKSIRLIIAFAAVGFAASVLQAQSAPVEEKKENKAAKCCARADEKGEKCSHGCCGEAAEKGKNCERCGGHGPKEQKKEEKKAS